MNRLYLDYFWGDFRIGGRIDESLRENSLFGEFLNQRYLEYTRPQFSFRIGNFYETFGQGLILSLFEEEGLNIDRNMDGAEASMDLDRFNLKVLGGRPREERGRRDNLLYGAEAKLFPFSYLQTGASYLRFDATNTPEDSSFGFPIEEWIDLMGRILIGPIQIITDYAKGYQWGEYDPSKGWIGIEGVSSYGFYLHTNFLPFQALG